MTSRKHTHTGHCQACTHIQAVSVTTGGIAKHGYTTRFGFFAGTCKGSDKLSLQVSREYADAILVELAAYAAEHDAHVAALQAGTKTPLVIVTQDYDRDEQGRIKTDHQGNRLRVRIPFAQGSVYQQRDAVQSAIYRHENEARGARAHARDLGALIPKIHGQPLIAVKTVDPVAAAPLAVGDTVRLGGAKGRDEIVVEIAVKQCQGQGPHLNGQHLPHAIFARESGKRYAVPVRLIRKAAIVKRAAQG